MTEYDDKLIKTALECGATKAAMIEVSSIVMSDSFRKICEGNGCGSYGRCYACPPDCGDVYELMDKVKSYKYGLLYQYIGTIEDSFDIEGMSECKVEYTKITQKVNDAVKDILPGKFFHLGGGGCKLCEKCAKQDNLPCRHPDKVLVPMEGAGIDVYNTSKGTGLKYINGENTVTYFAVVLFGE